MGAEDAAAIEGILVVVAVSAAKVGAGTAGMAEAGMMTVVVVVAVVVETEDAAGKAVSWEE